MGFYLPHQDATWESVEHSKFYRFEDMYEKNRKKRCDVKVYQLGRDVNGGEGSLTEVFLCVLCGTNGCHVKCADLGDDEEFRCEDCGGSVELERDQTTGQRRLQGENSVMEVSAASGPESSILEASSVTDVDDESDKSGDISITSLLKDSSLDTTTSSGDSLQNVNDFVKQFELGSGLSSSKLLDSSVNSEDQHNSSVDSV